jgi:hypothetical protein
MTAADHHAIRAARHASLCRLRTEEPVQPDPDVKQSRLPRAPADS